MTRRGLRVCLVALAVRMPRRRRGATPAATPPPIRDIAPPVDVFPYPLWLVAWWVRRSCLVVALVGWLLRPLVEKRPAATAAITARDCAPRIGEPAAEVGRPRSVRFQHRGFRYAPHLHRRAIRLHAREQTSPEFLAAIAGSPRFAEERRATRPFPGESGYDQVCARGRESARRAQELLQRPPRLCREEAMNRGIRSGNHLCASVAAPSAAGASALAWLRGAAWRACRRLSFHPSAVAANWPRPAVARRARC